MQVRNHSRWRHSLAEKTYLVESSVVTTVNQTVIAGKVDDMVRKLEVPQGKFVLLLS